MKRCYISGRPSCANGKKNNFIPNTYNYVLKRSIETEIQKLIDILIKKSLFWFCLYINENPYVRVTAYNHRHPVGGGG